MRSSKGVFFPGLNGLRFFAAAAVMVTHIELMKFHLRNPYGLKSFWFDLWGKWHTGDQMGQRIVTSTPLEAIQTLPNIEWYHPLIAEAGPLGVVFFFVLSGFLITYLLFKEHEISSTIAVRKFYIRRLLRIWPLYYLIAIIGFAILPQFGIFDIPEQRAILEAPPQKYWTNITLFLLLLPNMAMAIYGPFPNIGHLWSIGVEEQFYVGWPLLMKKVRNHLKAILLFLVGFVAFKGALLLLDGSFTGKAWDAVLRFFAMTKLESMAIGGLGAWVLYHEKQHILQFIYKPWVQRIAYLAIPILLFITPAFLQNGIHVLHSVLFLVIILNVSTNPKSLLKLENRVFHFLGKISFGLYMYHFLIVTAVIHLTSPLLPLSERTGWLANVLFYGLSFGLSIGISYLSYRFFETPFIRMKSRFTKVTSGEDAR